MIPVLVIKAGGVLYTAQNTGKTAYDRNNKQKNIYNTTGDASSFPSSRWECILLLKLNTNQNLSYQFPSQRLGTRLQQLII